MLKFQNNGKGNNGDFFEGSTRFVISVVACEKGFWGNNCTKPCPFPSYGKECQLECSCKKEVCDHANGCQDITGTFLHAEYKCY